MKNQKLEEAPPASRCCLCTPVHMLTFRHACGGAHTLWDTLRSHSVPPGRQSSSPFKRLIPSFQWITFLSSLCLISNKRWDPELGPLAILYAVLLSNLVCTWQGIQLISDPRTQMQASVKPCVTL